MNLHKMIEICLKDDNMYIFLMMNALICINNYVITCMNNMLSISPTFYSLPISSFLYLFFISYLYSKINPNHNLIPFFNLHAILHSSHDSFSILSVLHIFSITIISLFSHIIAISLIIYSSIQFTLVIYSLIYNTNPSHY